jgi:hypothetical protein
MRPGSHERIPTVADAVGRAAAIVDPEGVETAVTALYEGFEDDDRPATAVRHLAGELLSTVRAIDPEEDDPAAAVAVAAATWLARHPSQAEEGDRVVREGVRLLFSAQPPQPVADWLAARGFAV